MNILVCTDLSESSEKVLFNAAEIAKANAAKLWVIHIISPDQGFVGYESAGLSQSGFLGYEIDSQSNSLPIRDFISQRIRQSHCHIQQISSKFRHEGLDTTALLIQGEKVETILLQASKLNIDLLIIGSHGRGILHQLLLGSVSEQVIQNAKCPIMVIPTNERH